MNRRFLWALSLSLLVVQPCLHADPGPMQLWFAAPADAFTSDWTSEDALPVGNGKIAAMIYGGVEQEVIQFNEDTIWAGSPHDYSHAGASGYLSQIQNHIWNGDGGSAKSLTDAYFMSEPLRQSPYQPAGELRLTFAHVGTLNYRRTLDLETAIASVEYDDSGVGYRREVFASYPDQVIVVRLTADQTASLSFGCTFTTPHSSYSVSTSGTDLILDANVNDDPDSRRQTISAVDYQARVRVIAEGGSVTAGGTSISVSNADAVILLFHVASNVVGYDDVSADPGARTLAAINAAAAKPYAALLADHLSDYQELFNRVVIDLGTSVKTNLSTAQRLDDINAALSVTAVNNAQKSQDIETWTQLFAGDDPQFLAVNVQMARYLTIAGSRPGSQPLNLQGKWNNRINPSWESKMTLNINQEMNYWAAEMANLAECHEPMVDLVRDLSESGATVAQVHYDANGWMVHHNTDLWRGAAPINNVGGVWPTGGAWLSMHLWWHYLYSGDTNVLAEIYPLMKGAAEFFDGFLVNDPRSGNPPYLMTNPSHSPEHPNPALDDELVAGPTMDNQLIRALFGYVIEASEILGVDGSFRTNLMTKRAQLPPNQIGQYGQLQEWLEDVDQPENPAVGGHRHLSHLVGLFPGDEISPIYEADFAAAARVPLDWKGDLSNNTSWSRAWKMCLRTALLAGDHAYMILNDVIGRSHTDNMVFSNKGANECQVDGNFGVLMGTLMFFLQNARGEIHVLPALPTKIPAGNITGLRSPGGFEVDVVWENHRLQSAAIHSDRGGDCRIRCAWPISVKRGAEFVDAPMILPGLWEFSTSAGLTYDIVPANLWEVEWLPAGTSGDPLSTVGNPMFSNQEGRRLDADAVNDFVTYQLTNVIAGTYRVHVVTDAGPDRGRFQLSAGPHAGVLATLGGTNDTYSPTNFVTLYSTNMLTEHDCGVLELAADGDCDFRFTVTGKNAASSGHALVVDYIKLTPVPPPPNPTLGATLEGGQIVLSWPTNFSDYSLVSATDPTAASWAPVTPAPVVVGDLNVVTNNALEEQAFYRLVSP